MVVLDQQFFDDFSAGVIGIGDEIKRLIKPQGVDEDYHFIQQCFRIPIGKPPAPHEFG